ncbi:MAG: hypothetical protein WBV47_05725, partial [Salegentibacter sp.]
MKIFLLLSLYALSSAGFSQTNKSEILPADVQIKTALLAAPEEERSGAMVYGYDENGKLVVLRKGTNYLVCLADNPFREGIEVACYSKKLEPFMARGRELVAEGKSEMEKREIRKKEA